MFSSKLRALALLILASPTRVIFGADLWVAPNGSDQNHGTSSAPFASVSAALRQARELRRLSDPSISSGVRIILRDGTYSLTEPVWIRPEDSGTAASPTVIEAASDAQPILSGGIRLTSWEKTSAVIPGLPAAADNNVWVARAPHFSGRPLEFRQLWVGDRRAVRARTPNGETMARLLKWDRENKSAALPTAALDGLRDPSGVELVVQQQWEIAILRLDTLRIADGEAWITFHEPESRIEFEHPWPQPILPPEGGGAFFLANAIEFLDQPGEWYHDRARGLVYYWPRDESELLREEAVVPVLETLVQVEGSLDRPVQYVSLRGLHFKHTTWLRPSTDGHVPLQGGMYLIDAYKLKPKGTPDWRSLDNQAWIGRPPAAVTARSVQHLRIERCRFENLAFNGLDVVAGTQQAIIEGNVFREIGGNGLVLGAFQEGPIETHLPYNPADQREVCADVRIANNVVSDCANEDWGCVGINVGYARKVAIEHNEVFNVSYTAISLGWGWTRTANAMRDNRVHANHLHHFATRMCDTAGVYTLSNQPGTIVSENSIHSIKMSPYVDRPDHWFYLYTDEGSSFITVRDNWCAEAKFLQNANGPGNVWENNGPQVLEEIKARAGLEPAFRNLLP